MLHIRYCLVLLVNCDGYEEGRLHGGGLALLPPLIEHLLRTLYPR
jgi:hypothetical protein